MNVKKVLEELTRKYPGKNIIQNSNKNPTEIICEIDPASEHLEKSIAIAVIDKTEPHFHKKSTEIYRVIKGRLTLYKNGKEYRLKEGDSITINPNEVHSATGNEVWVKVYSRPGWILRDHLSVEKEEFK